MIIKVTQEHLDKGEWLSASNSPVTLALKEVGFKEVLVFRYDIYIGKYKTLFSKHLFDTEPFEFEIKLPLLLRLRCLLK